LGLDVELETGNSLESAENGPKYRAECHAMQKIVMPVLRSVLNSKFHRKIDLKSYKNAKLPKDNFHCNTPLKSDNFF